MKNDITLKEIATRAGVSITTVSRTLNEPESVRPITRNLILNTIKDLNGTRQHSMLIALVIPDMSNQFFPLLLKGIESITKAQGYNLLLFNSEGSSANEDSILTKLSSMPIDGIIFICSGKATNLLRNYAKQKRTPLIFLDRDPDLPGIPLVKTDNEAGMYQAAKYLISLGHKNLLYIAGQAETSTDRERYRGFKKAIEQNTHNEIEHKRVEGNYSTECAYNTVKNLIKDGQFSYTAICAANDAMAFGAFKALTEHGLKIPGDVSIIGYDDIPSASLINLTTIRQPFEDMGRASAIQLITAIQQARSVTATINSFDSTIIIRETCALPRNASKQI